MGQEGEGKGKLKMEIPVRIAGEVDRRSFRHSGHKEGLR